MKTKSIILIGVAILAVLAIVAGVVFATQKGGGEVSLASRISNGEKYLSSGEYDKAILSFKEALKKDDKNESAYLGLGEAYYQSGYMGLARQTLEEGYNITGSQEIYAMLALYFPDFATRLGMGGEDDPEAAGKSDTSVEPVLNTELLNFLGSANYSDYCGKYGNVSCMVSGGKYMVTAAGLEADLYYFDTENLKIINSASNEPYREFLPNEIVLRYISMLFGGAKTVTYDRLQNMAGITNLQNDGQHVTFEACGCKMTIACDESGTIREGAENLIVPTGEQVSTKLHTLQGSVIDAASGMSVGDALLQFYAGTDAYGTPMEVKTDASGKYTLDVEQSGDFTVVISKTGYITETFRFYVAQSTQIVMNDFTISTQLNSEEVRIVLTWGAYPSDLDSYLRGSTDSGKYVSIDFENQVCYEGDKKAAELDVDDMDAYGPETTTIYNTNGTFDFYVVDYNTTGTMASSGATVKIYVGNSLAETVYVPGSVENGWHVCRIDHGSVYVYNEPYSAPSGRLSY